MSRKKPICPPGLWHVRRLSGIALRKLISETVACALAEDIGCGDVSSAIFSGKEKAQARFIAKQSGVLSGTDLIKEVFCQLSPSIKVRLLKKDGERFAPKDVLAEVEGPLPLLLTGERLALNFLQQLSGVATLTRQFVDALPKDSPVGIYDTRKTVPLMRMLQKRAVVHGGGRNHRYGLDDMAMLKNNHIDAAGGVANAIARLRDSQRGSRKRVPVCIEARDLEEASQALVAGADIIMLDNMNARQVKSAVARLRALAQDKRLTMPQIEISGGITLKNLGTYANLPIDRISVGALTHSAPAVDISMRYAG